MAAGAGQDPRGGGCVADGKNTRRAAAADSQARVEQMREATEVAREFAKANAEAAASVRELQAALDQLAGLAAAINARHPAKAVIAAAADAAARGMP